MNETFLQILIGLAAFAAGGAVAVGNHLLSRAITKRGGGVKDVSLAAFARQAVNVGFFVAVFLIARAAGWPLYAVLIGAALGLTVPAVIFNVKAAKSRDK